MNTLPARGSAFPSADLKHGQSNYACGRNPSSRPGVKVDVRASLVAPSCPDECRPLRQQTALGIPRHSSHIRNVQVSDHCFRRFAWRKMPETSDAASPRFRMQTLEHSDTAV